MDEAILSEPGSDDSGLMTELWRLDAATCALLRQVNPLVSARLAGIEADFDQVFMADPKSGALLNDISLRHQETERLAAFYYTAFRYGPDDGTADRAAELGRHHADLGLDGRAIRAAAERVLERACEGVLANSLDPLPAIEAVTRLVFQGLDASSAAFRARDVDRYRNTAAGVDAEALQEQIHALEEIARIDSLTKLFNRRHFDTALESEISRAHRYRLPLSLIMADVDFFKRINDSYGHLIGDEVLCHVAEVLQAGARRSDMLARYGGEEFAIILTQTPGDHALIVAERVRVALEQRPLAFADGHVVPVTISLGCAALTAGDTPRNLIERADAALYRAKEGGRNRVSV
jgi:diguanylate cyclase (GGDEF)-like protein